MKKKLPPFYFQIALVLCVLLHLTIPAKQVIYSPLRFIGIIFIAVGVWLNLWTDSLFKKKKTTVKPFKKPSVFITEGPFRFSRHPMYLGMLSILAGTAILLGSLTPFIPAVIFCIIMQIVFIPAEEKDMEKVFRDKYREYKARVRIWL